MEQISQIIVGINSQCEIHKKLGLIFAGLNSSDPNPFYCSTCAAKRHKQAVPFVSIQDILTSDQETQPIQNWPPGIDDDITQFLYNKKTELIRDQLRNRIMNFYDNLSKEINIAINESKKEQFNELSKITFDFEQTIDLYNKLFKRKELVTIFENVNEESKDQYKKLLDTMSVNSKRDLGILSQFINEKKEQEIRFREFQDNSIKALSEKFTQILNNLSLSLFKINDNDLTEKYHFKEINSQFVNKNQDESQSEVNKNIEPYQLQDKQLFLSSRSKFVINHLSNGITSVKNPCQKEGYCIDIYNIDESETQTFKIKFDNMNSFENFYFGFYGYLRNGIINEDEIWVLKESWKKVISLSKVNINPDEDLILLFSYDKNMFKVKSKFFKDSFIKKFSSHKPNYHYNLLFGLSKDCSGFEISSYSLQQ